MSKHEMGVVGLGVMGRNLTLNIADHGHSVVGYDKNPKKADLLRSEKSDAVAVDSVEDLVKNLKKPRAILILVPAGDIVDAVIKDLVPQLESDDIILDAGNSHYTDTNLRADAMQSRNIRFLGVGVSGGEHGARYGPSIMPGGPQDAYDRVSGILTDAAAHVNGDPCVTWLGPGSAGHYVKMVHNGIEYGIMQLIAESYDLMKRGFGLGDSELHDIYAQWNDGMLSGFLMEITAQIFARMDDQTGEPLIDQILDAAKQKGTGKWTSQDAMELQVPTPTIDVAVAARNMSALEPEREAASDVLTGPKREWNGDRRAMLDNVERSLYASILIVFAQGMRQLAAASEAYDYGLKLADVARIWRGGCIIRAAVLEHIRSAFEQKPDLTNLLTAKPFSEDVMSRQDDLRIVVQTAATLGIPAPAMMASLAYFDSYRSAWLPANLIQAQRDFFGSHTYERKDQKGQFHTQWRSD